MLSRHLALRGSALAAFLASPCLAALLGLQTLWGLWFIWRTSFEASSSRVFCLFDDAMISMTYARNLVEGQGLNWARFGTPVEGFTHPLWLLVMILVHLLPVSLVKASGIVQLVSLSLLLANVCAVRRLLEAHFSLELRRAVTWLPAAAATAFYYPLNHWALQGMETAAQSLLVVLGTLWTLDLASGRRQPRWALGVTFALACHLRLDSMVWVGLALIYLSLGARAAPWRIKEWLPLLLPGAASGLAYQIFRWAYFGDWLPNTYYLKMTGVPFDLQLLRGLWAFERFLQPIFPPLLLVVLAATLAVRKLPALKLPVVTVLTAFAYSIYVGGDVWEYGIGANRFVAFVMPLVFVIANAGLNGALTLASDRWRSDTCLRGLSAAGVLFGVFAFNGLFGREAPDRWTRLTITEPPTHVREHRTYTRTVMGIRRSKLLDRDARVAVVWAGIPAYFSNWQMVDLMGYNERTIAHGPLTEAIDVDRFRDYLPGHTKAQLAYVLDEYRPDVVFQTWGKSPEERGRILRSRGYVRRGKIWFRRDSPKLRLEAWPEDSNVFAKLGS